MNKKIRHSFYSEHVDTDDGGHDSFDSNPEDVCRWIEENFVLREEGSETVTNCQRLKMKAQDGKMRLTDVATVETLFRIIQSVPSKKAEPIKLWLAKVGNERLQEIADPEQSLNRARENWKQHGRSDKWVQQRMKTTKNERTAFWCGIMTGVFATSIYFLILCIIFLK